MAALEFISELGLLVNQYSRLCPKLPKRSRMNPRLARDLGRLLLQKDMENFASGDPNVT